MKTKPNWDEDITEAVQTIRRSMGVCSMEVMWDDDRDEPWNEATGSWGGEFAGVADMRKWAATNKEDRRVTIHASRDGADCDSITFTVRSASPRLAGVVVGR